MNFTSIICTLRGNDPALRRHGVRRGLCDPRRAAGHQDPRHLRAALEARRQARLPPPHAARRRAISNAICAHPALAQLQAWYEPASAGSARATGIAVTQRQGQTAMVLAAGYGQRMRPLTLTRAEAAGRGGGQGADRLRLRPAARRRRRDGRRQCPLSRRADRGLGGAAVQRRDIVISDERAELLDTGGGVAKALPLLGRRSRSSSSTAIQLLDRRRRTRARSAAREHGTMRRWTACCCCAHRPAPSAMTAGAISCAAATAGFARGKTDIGEALAYIGGYLVHAAAVRRTRPRASSR